ncbi:hypothetical protein [Pseudomonas sp. SCB32]|uniref:hypothetical protein n=1 Tax=Pseudomonas sp. SCB32 TaxID=2653853 RepID=UPI0012656BE4|nr:hypothetical protein [Pseudomonas sp. SCB32]
MTPLLRGVRSTVGWSFSLGKKFFRVVPVTTALIQVLTLGSQFLLLIAFFLPLKVMVLLGGTTIPIQFPAYLQSFERDWLIIVISGLALLCYILHVAMEFSLRLLSRRGAGLLLAHSRKIDLFEKQVKLATSAYSKYVRGLAAATFIVISFSILLYLYPSLCLVVVLYILTAFFSVVAVCSYSESAQKALRAKLGGGMSALASAGFMLAFFYIVADFLSGDHPSVWVAVISLLLIRQGLQRLAGMIQDVASLRAQRRQIGALFFHAQPLITENRFQDLQDHSALGQAARHVWISKVLREVERISPAELDVAWHQVGVAGVHAFEVACSDEGSGQQRRYLLKLFSGEVSALAAQELTLLSSSRALPCPCFISACSVGGMRCHVFAWRGESKVNRRQVGPAVLAVTAYLMTIEPPKDLLQRFKRSRQSLEWRLDARQIESLGIAASLPGQAESLQRFLQVFDHVRELLSALPRQIASLDMTSETLLVNDSGEFLLSHWPSWRIEPLGAGWPVDEREKLAGALATAKTLRPGLAAVPLSAVTLAALVYAFERFCSQRNYASALALLADVLSLLREEVVQEELQHG